MTSRAGWSCWVSFFVWIVKIQSCWRVDLLLVCYWPVPVICQLIMHEGLVSGTDEREARLPRNLSVQVFHGLGHFGHWKQSKFWWLHMQDQINGQAPHTTAIISSLVLANTINDAQSPHPMQLQVLITLVHSWHLEIFWLHIVYRIRSLPQLQMQRTSPIWTKPNRHCLHQRRYFAGLDPESEFWLESCISRA